MELYCVHILKPTSACQTKYLLMHRSINSDSSLLVPPIHFSLSICITMSCYSIVTVRFVCHKACRPIIFHQSITAVDGRVAQDYTAPNISYFLLMALKLLPRCGLFSSLSARANRPNRKKRNGLLRKLSRKVWERVEKPGQSCSTSPGS